MRLAAAHLTMLLALAACAGAPARPAAAASAAPPMPSSSALADSYREPANRIIDAALADSSAFRRLAELTDRFGARFSGTPALEQAIDWALAEMRRDGLANVRGEPVMVPRWVRGEESAELVSPRRQAMRMLGLGGSVGTPREGITAPVLVVSSFEELIARSAEARGKIVVYDVPFTTYRETVRYRSRGAIAAAQAGAVASLLRSVTPYSMYTPHTGSMVYDSTAARIPHAAITVEDAQLLHRLQLNGQRPVVTLRMSARTFPDVSSRNVVAELVGSERPEEIVVLGGHMDSWDVGQGAMDDGGGVVAAWEAVRLIQRLGLKPRRTIRVVLWTNEENGLRGGRAYRDAHAAELANHVLAIESDGGVFAPIGFGVDGTDSTLAVAGRVASLLDRIGSGRVERGGGEADISPIVVLGVPGMGLRVDGTRYFWYHHTDADTMDKLDPREMALCVATMAVMAYVVADMPERLPRGVQTR